MYPVFANWWGMASSHCALIVHRYTVTSSYHVASPPVTFIPVIRLAETLNPKP